MGDTESTSESNKRVITQTVIDQHIENINKSITKEVRTIAQKCGSSTQSDQIADFSGGTGDLNLSGFNFSSKASVKLSCVSKSEIQDTVKKAVQTEIVNSLTDQQNADFTSVLNSSINDSTSMRIADSTSTHTMDNLDVRNQLSMKLKQTIHNITEKHLDETFSQNAHSSANSRQALVARNRTGNINIHDVQFTNELEAYVEAIQNVKKFSDMTEEFLEKFNLERVTEQKVIGDTTQETDLTKTDAMAEVGKGVGEGIKSVSGGVGDVLSGAGKSVGSLGTAADAGADLVSKLPWILGIIAIVLVLGGIAYMMIRNNPTDAEESLMEEFAERRAAAREGEGEGEGEGEDEGEGEGEDEGEYYEHRGGFINIISQLLKSFTYSEKNPESIVKNYIIHHTI